VCVCVRYCVCVCRLMDVNMRKDDEVTQLRTQLSHISMGANETHETERKEKEVERIDLTGVAPLCACGVCACLCVCVLCV